MDLQDIILLIAVVIILFYLNSQRNKNNTNVGGNNVPNAYNNIENTPQNPFWNAPYIPPSEEVYVPPVVVEEEEEVYVPPIVEEDIEEEREILYGPGVYGPPAEEEDEKKEIVVEPLPVRRYIINNPWGWNQGTDIPRIVSLSQCMEEAIANPYGSNFTYDTDRHKCYIYDQTSDPQQKNSYTFGFEIDPCCNWLNPLEEGDYNSSPTGIDINAWDIALNTKSDGGDITADGFPKYNMTLKECEDATNQFAENMEVAGFAYKFTNGWCRPKTYFMPVYNTGWQGATFEYKK